MSSNKNLTKQIKRNILNNNCDYDVICELLVVNPEEVISGILSSYLYLFRNIDNISNKDLLEDLDTILNNYIKKYKNKTGRILSKSHFDRQFLLNFYAIL